MAHDVGVRDFKNGASRYVALAEGGDVITVTKRGKPVARLVPAGLPSEMEKLLEDGTIGWTGRRPAFGRPARLRGAGKTAAEYVLEGRR